MKVSDEEVRRLDDGHGTWAFERFQVWRMG